IDVAVEHEVTAGRAAVKAADDVRHCLLRRDHAMGQAVTVEIIRDELCGLTRVARRIWTPGADEALQELDQLCPLLLDPALEPLPVGDHAFLPLKPFLSQSPVRRGCDHTSFIARSRGNRQTPERSASGGTGHAYVARPAHSCGRAFSDAHLIEVVGA